MAKSEIETREFKMLEEDRVRLKIMAEMIRDAKYRLKIVSGYWDDEVSRVREKMKIPPEYNTLNIDEGTFKKGK